MELLKLSNDREKRAIALLKTLNLRDLVGRNAKINISGSLKHHTVIKPDIDLVIISKNINKTLELLNNFFSKDRHTIRKWVEDRKSLGGKSIHIFYKNSLIWKLDILIAKKYKIDKYEKLNTISIQKRKNILRIKNYFYKKKLKLASLSTHIYDAVIEKDIKNIDEFHKYLQQLNIDKKDFKKDTWEKLK